MKRVFRSAGLSAVAAAFVAASACADPGEPMMVANVAQLTNALNIAVDGDVIVLKKGGDFVFNDEFMGTETVATDVIVTNLLEVRVSNLTIKGEDETPRATWTDHAEPVILNGNGKGRILRFQTNKTGANVQHITFTGGDAGSKDKMYGGAVYAPAESYVTFSNCIFRQNKAYYEGAAYRVTIRDCCVTNCNSYMRNAFRGDAYDSDFIDNNPAAGEYINAYNCRFIGNYRNGGASVIANPYVISNCLITGTSGTLGFDCSSGARFYDCIFTNNTLYQACLLNPPLVSGCLFIDNACTTAPAINMISARSGLAMTCAVERCKFIRNSSTQYGNSGAIYMGRSNSDFINLAMTVSNCLFEGNIGGNAGVSRPGGAIWNATNFLPVGKSVWDNCLVVNCTFRTNTAGCAAGVFGVHAVNCVFDKNLRTGASGTSVDAYGGDAQSSYLERCDLNGGEIMDCVLDRCTIHDVTNSVKCAFHEYIRMTNSIVANCHLFDDDRAMYKSQRSLDAEFVNCTFVTNDMSTYSLWAQISDTNSVRFVNSVFHGNRRKDLVSDIVAYDRSAKDLWSKFEFENTYYGTFAAGTLTAAQFATKTNGVNRLMECVDPRFAGRNASIAAKFPSEPYWALSYSSPLLGKGSVLDWPEDATDLAGRARTRDGKVDIGCYECWLNPPGMFLILK